jgi:hypothetical protein
MPCWRLIGGGRTASLCQESRRYAHTGPAHGRFCRIQQARPSAHLVCHHRTRDGKRGRIPMPCWRLGGEGRQRRLAESRAVQSTQAAHTKHFAGCSRHEPLLTSSITIALVLESVAAFRCLVGDWVGREDSIAWLRVATFSAHRPRTQKISQNSAGTGLCSPRLSPLHSYWKAWPYSDALLETESGLGGQRRLAESRDVQRTQAAHTKHFAGFSRHGPLLTSSITITLVLESVAALRCLVGDWVGVGRTASLG